MIVIRPEREADWDAIDRVNREAFRGLYEAALVRRLRHDGVAAASLVADDDGRIEHFQGEARASSGSVEAGCALVGHLMLSWLPTNVDGRDVRAVALAPMAVLPDRQRQGIGSRLVRSSLETSSVLGVEAIIVVGHPGYYPRFGFSAAAASRLSAPFSGKAFMALEIVPNVLRGKAATVRYPPAFGIDTPLVSPSSLE